MTRAADPSWKSKSRRATRATALVLSWRISRDAAASAGLADARDAGPVRLEIRVLSSAGTGATAALCDGADRRELPAGGRGRWVRVGELEHLDIPGTLSLTLRRRAGAVQVLYARSELIRSLGLPGGRAEFEGASLD